MASRMQELNLNDSNSALVWIKSFKAIGRAKKWKDDKDSLEITDNFMGTCGLASLTKIMSIVAPLNVEDMPFADIEQAITSYLQPEKRLLIAERTKFYDERQKPTETITEFVARLREKSKFCEFDELKKAKSPQEEMIKMATVAGMFRKENQARVLEKMQMQDMNVPEIITFVQQLEQVAEFTKSSTSTSPSVANDIHYGNHNKGGNKHVKKTSFSSSRHRNSGSSTVTCHRCGKTGHMAKDCIKSLVVCFKCHRRGHYANECNFVGTRDSSDEENVNNKCDYTDIYSVEEVNGGALKNIHVVINHKDHTLLMQEDTGASCTIMSTRIWKKIGKPRLEKFKGRPLRSYDGTALKIIGTLSVLIEYRKRYDVLEVRVVESDKNFGLLGRDILDNQVHSVSSSPNSKETPSQLGCIRNAKATLRVPQGVKPIFCNSRDVALPLQKSVENELQRMLDMGVISPVPPGGSEWASPLVCARKPDNSVRICCDYKITINKYLLNDRYNTPDIEAIFSKLEGSKVFAKFDLKSAYWQIELDEESKKLTTINTTKGLYWFNRLPFGVKTASSIFQRVIENVCLGLDGVIVYQDDILVYASNDDELKLRSERLLQRLNKRNVSINWTKSVRSAESVTFLGHVISADGIRPDSRLVNKVLQISAPRTQKEVQRFIGLVNFYGNKIQNFARICEPINRLRRNGVPFSWGSEQQECFERLKGLLCSDLVVKPYSLRKELTLECDASEASVSAILSQEGDPVMYLSRTLNANERNYAVIEKEALAIVWAVKRAEKFLLGRTFTIRTDHRALEFIFGEHKSLPKHTSARIQRWAILMMGYDYNIEYVRGEDIPHVDALNRLNFAEEECNVELDCDLNESVYWTDECGVTWKDMVQETLSDRFLTGIKRRIQTGQWKNCSPAELQYKKNQAALSIENHVIILGTRPVVPRLLRNKIMETAHSSHFGMSTTKMVLKKNVWWPGMDRDVEEFVRHCETCRQKPKANTESHRHRWEAATRPFERIHVDWAQVPNIGIVLIIVDAFSGWPEAFVCLDRSSHPVKRVFQSLFARYGVPQQIVTDNAKEFIASDLLQWLSKVGAEALQTPQYHSCSNGLVERMVQTLKRVLRIYSIEKGDPHTFLQKVLMTYRSSRVTSSRGCTPSELFIGREMRNPLFVFDCHQMWYTSKPGRPSERCEFLVQNSERTAYVDCKGTVRLAHIDQLKEATGSNEREQEEVCNNDANNVATMDIDEDDDTTRLAVLPEAGNNTEIRNDDIDEVRMDGIDAEIQGGEIQNNAILRNVAEVQKNDTLVPKSQDNGVVVGEASNIRVGRRQRTTPKWMGDYVLN